MFERFIQRLSKRKKPANNSAPPSDPPTIVLQQEIGRPALHEPTVLQLLTPIPQPVRAASPVVGPDGLTAKERHLARVKAFREADQQQRAAARQELARGLASGELITGDQLHREGIETYLRRRDLGLGL